jgi:Ca2+-binding RTX toxin-like protein
MTNKIVTENERTDGLTLSNGDPLTRDYWDVPHSNQIEGFTTDISVNASTTIEFKINVNGDPGSDYRIEIFRLGYYGGAGAREVAEWTNTNATVQPNPIFDESLGLVDAGNWSVTDSWQVPETAVSGVYLARLQRLDANGNPIDGAVNQIPFIVRNDGEPADIVLQTSDTTWHAYNGWAGNNGLVGPNFYGDAAGIVDHDPVPDPGLGAQDRAYAVSYNRPFITRDGTSPASGAQDYLFGADYAAIYWLEKSGYDVTYISGVDTDRLGTSWFEDSQGTVLRQAYISVGHDEYWSGDQRANVEAARDAGVNLLFWSGNEVYWKTRYEDGIGGSTDDYRTLVSYKETWANGDPNASPEDYANIDPSTEWTGTWRDLRFVGNPEATGQEPENSLTGQLFGPDGTGQFGGALDVPAPFAGLRVWRDTSVANGGTLDMAPGILGYEWNTSPEDAYRPSGLIKLSETTIPWNGILVDQGNRVEPGIATHNLSLYRDPESGALVFGAGTVFWSWALSNEHDSSPYGANIENLAIQQFTVNMFADMGIQPGVSDAILQSQGLVRASGSSDATAATTSINDLPETVSALSNVLITGTAADFNGTPGVTTDDGKVAVVEVSLDGGATWKVAKTTDGWATWSYVWRPANSDVGTSKTILARAIDDSLNVTGITPATDTVTITEAIPPDTLSLFDPLVPVTGGTFNDNQPVELGMKFTASQAGQVTQLKYYRSTSDATDVDTRDGHLWSSDGTLLATATFISGVGASGWQVADLSGPVTLTPGVEYIVSYRTQNNYVSSQGYFAPANEVTFDGIDDDSFTDPFGVLSAPQNTVASPNGVYAYGSALVIPTDTFNASNYWVDVTFTTYTGPNRAPVITSPDSFSVAENRTTVGTVTANDLDGNPLTFEIASGLDAGKFTINPTTGVLAFADAPDFETPTDAGEDNVYDVTVQVSDGNGGTAQQNISVAVTNLSEGTVSFSLFDATDLPALTITDSSTPADGGDYELGVRFTASQNGTITALRYYRGVEDSTDTDTRTLKLWDAGGNLLASAAVTSDPDESGWQVVTLPTPVSITAGTTYVASYNTAQNYSYTGSYFDQAQPGPGGVLNPELSPDVGSTNGVYNETQGLFPTTSNNDANYWVDVIFEPSSAVNLAPTITSNGGGSVAPPITIDENTTLVTTVTATDEDVPAQTLTYSLAGGENASLFTIDPVTGVLSFLSAPDYEALPAPGATPGYQVTVQVSDGNGGTDTQDLTVNVRDLQEGSGTDTGFGANTVQVAYVFGAADRVPATDVFGPDAVQTVTADATLGTIDVANLPEPGGDIGNGNYGLSSVDFADTAIRIEFPLDPTVFATALTNNTHVNFASEVERPYNGVLIRDTTNSLAPIRGVTVTDQAGFLIPLSNLNLSFTADSIFLNVNDLTNGTGQTQSRLVDSDLTTNGIQASFVTLAVDFNDAPTAVTLNNPLSPSEFTPNGFVVGTLSATDIDASETFTYTLTDDADGRFTIVGNELRVANGLLLDFEQAPSHNVVIRVTDGSGATYDQALTVNVTDVNPEDVIGSNADNTFWGGALSDDLSGGNGNDTLKGGLGDDTLTGGAGSDIFVRDANDPNATQSDTITDFTIPGGEIVESDKIDLGPAGPASFSALSQFLLRTNGSGHATLSGFWNGNAQLLTLTGISAAALSADQFLFDTSGTPRDIDGTSNADLIFGGLGDDDLNGGDGNDTLVGDLGADTMTGGAGNDTYGVDDVGDVVVERATDPGTDLVLATASFDASGESQDGIELIYLGGTAAINATGNALDNTLQGNSAANTLVGNGGNDRLFGNGGDDTLTTGSGNDLLNGGTGADTMTGGAGNDTYIVDDANDTIVELSSDAGTDLVQATASVDASGMNQTGIELIYLGGTAAINATGNALDNTLQGNDNSNTLIGNGGNDRLFGNGGDDTLTTGAGNDLLHGGTGADTMTGGAGNDTYNVDDANDTIVELATDAGTDLVQATASVDASGENQSGIELIYLGGSAAINATGNALDNVLQGNENSNTLIGNGGTDRLFGNGGNDTLTTGTGNDLLNGGTGADTMTGGAGNDTYIVDNINDVVIELSTHSGIDLVQSTVSFHATGADQSGIENIYLGGTGLANATGNALDNTIQGNENLNVLVGNGGNDRLFGNGGDDILTTGSGNDLLNGGTGGDIMTGGAGNDTYIVDSIDDIVIEVATATGTDLVQSTVTFNASGTDQDGIELVYLGGTGAIDATGNARPNVLQGNDNVNTLIGNAGNDRLFGNGEADRLDGGEGLDILTGGAGADTFVFRTGYATDMIMDFLSGTDKVDLVGVGFADGTEVLSAITDRGSYASLTLTDGSELYFMGVQKAALAETDFMV